jgi:hypothetical protein
MSDLIDLQQKLQDTLAALQRARQLLAADPKDFEFSLVVKSLEQRQQTLEQAFAVESAHAGIDVCKYRLIRPENTYPVAAFADSIKDFQSVLTVFFDALRNGPKRRATSSAFLLPKAHLNGYMPMFVWGLSSAHANTPASPPASTTA